MSGDSCDQMLEKIYSESEGIHINIVPLLPGLVLFAMMIVVPSAYQDTKSVLLATVLVEVAIVTLSDKYISLHPKIFKMFLFYILLGAAYGVYGLLQNNLGALPITKEVVLYVIFYMILVNGITSLSIWRYVHRTLILASAFLSLYLIASVLNTYGIWPNWLFHSLETNTSDAEINTGALATYGRFSTSFTSFPGFLFLQPYLLTYLMVSPRKRKRWAWLLVVTMTIIMVFCGRRILLIVALMSPIVIFVMIRLLRRGSPGLLAPWKSSSKWRHFLLYLATTILLLFAVVRISGVDIGSTFNHLVNAFAAEQLRPGGKVMYNVRLETIDKLFQGWKESPLVGFGNGASYAQYLRSYDQPWNYEVEYMQFLYSWGIIGVMLYGLGIYFIIRMLVKIFLENSAYSEYAFSSLIGMCMFLVGNATNPYLLKIDRLFVIFIPVAIINLYLRRK